MGNGLEVVNALISYNGSTLWQNSNGVLPSPHHNVLISNAGSVLISNARSSQAAGQISKGFDLSSLSGSSNCLAVGLALPSPIPMAGVFRSTVSTYDNQENRKWTESHIDGRKTRIIPGISNKIKLIEIEYEKQKKEFHSFIGNHKNKFDAMVQTAIKKIVLLDFDNSKIELRDFETVVFTLGYGQGRKVYLRYHLLDEDESHKASFSYFEGKSFVTNGVGSLDNVINDLRKIVSSSFFFESGFAFAC